VTLDRLSLLAVDHRDPHMGDERLVRATPHELDRLHCEFPVYAATKPGAKRFWKQLDFVFAEPSTPLPPGTSKRPSKSLWNRLDQ
jgi:hypothetical protein